MLKPFDIYVPKLGRTLEFCCLNGQIFVDWNGEAGSRGKRLHTYGEFEGEPLDYEGNNQYDLEQICKVWTTYFMHKRVEPHQRLQSLLKKNNLTRSKAAAILGVNERTLYDWLNGLQPKVQKALGAIALLQALSDDDWP